MGGGKNLYKLLRQLVVPLIFFNCLPLLPNLLNVPQLGLFMTFKAMATELYQGLKIGNPPVGPSWFVLSLIWMRIVLDLCIWVTDGGRNLSIVTLIILMLNCGLAAFGIHQEFRYFCLANAFMAFPFYAAGYLMKENYEHLKDLWNRYRCWLLTVFFLIYVIGCLTNGSTLIQSCTFGRNTLMMYLTGFSGTMLAICLCSLIKRQNRWVYVLSCGMIVILCTHGFILNQTINKYPLFEIYSLPWYAYSLLACTAVMFVEIPIVLFFFRFLGWAVGGRKISNYKTK